METNYILVEDEQIKMVMGGRCVNIKWLIYTLITEYQRLKS